MVNAELQHNPYLLETDVKFNGQSPKINSQIEKYENQLLADWVRDVPKIFYDEMNGYDFDLFFSGTKYDFQKLKQAFTLLGVTSEQVRLIMRNELENAELKIREIEELIDWLRKEENRQFNFESFYDVNKELLEETFSCVIVRGVDELPNGLTFTLENVKGIEELSGINLAYVPVVFVVEERTLLQFRSELRELLKRKDVKQNQLFFCILPTIDIDYVIRFICDLGVEEPQVISSIDDGNIANYICNYPMVAHVREVIRIVEQEITTLDTKLKEENEQSAIENAEIYYQISELEGIIEKIKEADLCFVDLDNYSNGTRINNLKEELENSIRNWKVRKIKMVGETDISKNAIEYERELIRYCTEFYEKVTEYCKCEEERINRKFKDMYLIQPLDADFQPEGVGLNMPDKKQVMGIKEKLIDLKEECYEEKVDFFDIFKNSSESKELVRVVTCYYEKWREKAIELIMPGIEKYIEESKKNLQDYYNTLANRYHEKLSHLQEYKAEEKNRIASQLSEDERMLQVDNDWLIELKDKVTKIERG